MAYDLAIMGTPSDTLTDLTINNTANDGIYKLTQKIMILLLTDVSSQWNGGVGTDLPQNVFGGNISDLQILQNLFNMAISNVKDILIQVLPADAPSDERPASITALVSRSDDDRGEVIAEITVVSEAGEGTAIHVPISRFIETGE